MKIERKEIIPGILAGLAWIIGITAIVGLLAVVLALLGDILVWVLIGVGYTTAFALAQAALTGGIANWEHGKTIGYYVGFGLVGFPAAIIWLDGPSALDWVFLALCYIAAIPLTILWQEARYRNTNRYQQDLRTRAGPPG